MLITRVKAKEKLEKYLDYLDYGKIIFVDNSDTKNFENKKIKSNKKAGEFALRSGKKQYFRFRICDVKVLDETYDFIYDVKITKFNDIYGYQTKYNFNIIG